MTLLKSDFQDFMKRLRKLTPNRLKYYACGEYGTKNRRPHYHAIIFNTPAVSLFADAWSLQSFAIGKIDVGQVSGDSIAYVCKYMQKAGRIPEHKRDDRLPEFSLMSKGLGDNYLTDQAVKYHKDNYENLTLTLSDGHKIAMPKYYRDKIFSEAEKYAQTNIVKTAMDEINKVQDENARKQGICPDFARHDKKVKQYYLFLRNSKARKL